MFGGQTYEPSDGPRLGAQLERVAAYMSDGNWRTLYAIAHATGCSTQSVSARLRDLRKERYGSRIVSRRRVSAGVFEYRVCK